MSNKHWPRFLCRTHEGVYEERKFDTPSSVPEGEGWELITMPKSTPDTQDTAAIAELARMGQKVAEFARKAADDADAILRLETRLGMQTSYLERVSVYVRELETFATDLSTLPKAPAAVRERVAAIVAAAPGAMNQNASDEQASASEPAAKAGRAKKPSN